MAEAPALSISPHSSAAQIAQSYREGTLIRTLMQATGRSYQSIHDLLRNQGVALRAPSESIVLLESTPHALFTGTP